MLEPNDPMNLIPQELVPYTDPNGIQPAMQNTEAGQLEHDLGVQAINYETLQDDLANQASGAIQNMQVQGDMLASVLMQQAYQPLEQAKTAYSDISNHLESQLADAVGGVYNQAAMVSPIYSLQTMDTSSPTPPPAIALPTEVGGECGWYLSGNYGMGPRTLELVLRTLASLSKADLDANYCSNSIPGIDVPNADTGVGIWQLTIGGNNLTNRYTCLCINQQISGLASFDSNCPFPDCSGLPQPPQPPSPLPTPTEPTPKPPIPTPPTPKPPTPPSTQPGQSCEKPLYVKFCTDEEKKPLKYKAYCDQDGNIYIQDAEKPPQNSADKQIAEGNPDEWDFKELCTACEKKQKDKSKQSGGDTNLTPVGSIDCPFLAPTPGYGEGVPTTFLSQLFGTRDAKGNDRIPELIQGMPAIAKPFAGALAQLSMLITDSLGSVLSTFIANGTCKSPTYNSLVAAQTATGFLRQWFGADVRHLQQLTEYNQNSLCQIGIPTADQATAMWLSGTIDQPTLECLVKANNQRLDFWLPFVESQRARLSSGELLAAWRRELITGEVLIQKLRENGYIRELDRNLLADLTIQIPTVSDITSMMIRDVADEVNIDWSGSDQTFGQKYTGQLKKWGEFQGIPELMMKYIWRAHWQIPSPTQLFEFWHRLRYTGQLGTKDELYQKIRNALQQQDILPQWIDAYLAISFRPLTRVDVRRAFNRDLMTSAEVKAAYLDQGYSDDNADKLTKFAEFERERQYDKHPLIAQFVAGAVTLTDIDQELRANNISSPLVQRVLTKAQIALDRQRRKTCVKAYRKRFLSGEFDRLQSLNNLQGLGLTLAQATTIQQTWDCEKSTVGKQVPAATLCAWYQDGLITSLEFFDRLIKLEYDANDARMIVRNCADRLQKKIDADSAKQMRQMEREQEKAVRQAVKNTKDFETARKRAEAQAERNRAKAAQRQKLLVQAAEKMQPKLGISLSDTVVALGGIVRNALINTAQSTDFVYQAALQVAESDSVDSLESFAKEFATILAVTA